MRKLLSAKIVRIENSWSKCNKGAALALLRRSPVYGVCRNYFTWRRESNCRPQIKFGLNFICEILFRQRRRESQSSFALAYHNYLSLSVLVQCKSMSEPFLVSLPRRFWKFILTSHEDELNWTPPRRSAETNQSRPWQRIVRNIPFGKTIWSLLQFDGFCSSDSSKSTN